MEEYSEWLDALKPMQVYIIEAAIAKTAKVSPSTASKERDELEFFSQLNAYAKIEVWCAKAIWSVDEFVALSLGRNPAIVDVDKLSSVPTRSPFRTEYFRRFDLISRAVRAGDLKEENRPETFINWSIEKFNIPKSLLDFMNKKAVPKLDAEDPVNAVERNSLYRLTLGLALCYTDYDPNNKSRSNTVGNISKDLAAAGLNIDVKTIKRYLNEAESWVAEREIKVSKPTRILGQRKR